MSFNFPSILEKAPFDVSVYSNREKIEIMEHIMARSFQNIADELPVIESVKDGWYIRELRIPAGTLLTGKIHTEPHICLLSQGELSVMNDFDTKYLTAPDIQHLPSQ